MSVIGRTQLLVKSKNRLRCRFRWFVLTKKLAAAGASVRSNATCATRPSHRWGRSRRTWRATRASSRSRARSAARPSPSSSGSSSTCASTAARSPTPAPTAVTRSLIRSAVFFISEKLRQLDVWMVVVSYNTLSVFEHEWMQLDIWKNCRMNGKYISTQSAWRALICSVHRLPGTGSTVKQRERLKETHSALIIDYFLFAGKKFARGGQLLQHERTHTGERPWVSSWTFIIQ